MAAHIVRFFQRYAFFFSFLLGWIASYPIPPDDSNKWLKFAVFALVTLAVLKLLSKDGVTGLRANNQPGLTVLAIIGHSLGYWLVILFALLLIVAFAGSWAKDRFPFGQYINWPAALAIAALVLAAVAYAFGLSRAIRARRRSSNSYSVFFAYGSSREREDYPTIEAALNAAASLTKAGTKVVYVEDSDGNLVSRFAG